MKHISKPGPQLNMELDTPAAINGIQQAPAAPAAATKPTLNDSSISPAGSTTAPVKAAPARADAQSARATGASLGAKDTALKAKDAPPGDDASAVRAQAMSVSAEATTVRAEATTVRVNATTVRANATTVGAATKPVKANASTVRANAKPVQANDTSIKASTRPVAANATSAHPAATPTPPAAAPSGTPQPRHFQLPSQAMGDKEQGPGNQPGRPAACAIPSQKQQILKPMDARTQTLLAALGKTSAGAAAPAPATGKHGMMESKTRNQAGAPTQQHGGAQLGAGQQLAAAAAAAAAVPPAAAVPAVPAAAAAVAPAVPPAAAAAAVPQATAGKKRELIEPKAQNNKGLPGFTDNNAGGGARTGAKVAANPPAAKRQRGPRAAATPNTAGQGAHPAVIVTQNAAQGSRQVAAVQQDRAEGVQQAAAAHLAAQLSMHMAAVPKDRAKGEQQAAAVHLAAQVTRQPTMAVQNAAEGSRQAGTAPQTQVQGAQQQQQQQQQQHTAKKRDNKSTFILLDTPGLWHSKLVCECLDANSRQALFKTCWSAAELVVEQSPCIDLQLAGEVAASDCGIQTMRRLLKVAQRRKSGSLQLHLSKHIDADLWADVPKESLTGLKLSNISLTGSLLYGGLSFSDLTNVREIALGPGVTCDAVGNVAAITAAGGMPQSLTRIRASKYSCTAEPVKLLFSMLGQQLTKARLARHGATLPTPLRTLPLLTSLTLHTLDDRFMAVSEQLRQLQVVSADKVKTFASHTHRAVQWHRLEIKGPVCLSQLCHMPLKQIQHVSIADQLKCCAAIGPEQAVIATQHLAACPHLQLQALPTKCFSPKLPIFQLGGFIVVSASSLVPFCLSRLSGDCGVVFHNATAESAINLLPALKAAPSKLQGVHFLLCDVALQQKQGGFEAWRDAWAQLVQQLPDHIQEVGLAIQYRTRKDLADHLWQLAYMLPNTTRKVSIRVLLNVNEPAGPLPDNFLRMQERLGNRITCNYYGKPASTAGP